MQYRTNWKQFLKYDENGQRSHNFPVYLVDTAPNEKQYLYEDEYMAMVAAEKAVKDARRAAREAELAASRPEASESRASGKGRRGDSANPSDPVAILAGPPDFERHSRRCLICSHPDRDAIEGEFIRWRSPHKIARDYDITDRNSIYRHAHATRLFEARRRHVGRVLESYLETIDDTPPADFDPVTRAVRVYAHLNANGAWIEPLRRVHITHSRLDAPWPTQDLEETADPDFDPDTQPSDDDPHGSPIEPNNNYSDSSESATSAELAPESRRDDTTVARHAAQRSAGNTCGERRLPSARTPAPPFSREPQSTPSRLAGREACDRETGRDLSPSRHSSLATRHYLQGGEEKANRDNPKIKNRHNRLHRKDIPKVNRDKNSTSPSLHFRCPVSRFSLATRHPLASPPSGGSLATRTQESVIINHSEGKTRRTG